MQQPEPAKPDLQQHLTRFRVQSSAWIHSHTQLPLGNGSVLRSAREGNSIGRQRGIVGILVTCSRGPEVVDFVRKLCFLYAIICQEAAGLPAKAYTRPGSLCRLLCKPRNKSCRDAVLEAGQANARKDPA
eukprot:scaffold4050_cov18-Tisochrysis_lutea.AAC.1